MFGRKPKVPEGIDWAAQAVPLEVAEDKAGAFHPGDFQRVARHVRRQNLAYMRQTLAEQGGVVVGYHGTTTENADKIMSGTFENRRNEEDRVGVSAWHSVAAHRAIDFAQDRSRRAGVADAGRIIEVSMTNPEPDEKYGRLEWLADAASTEALRVYTPEELMRALGRVPLSHIHMGPNMDDGPDRFAA